MRDMRVSSWKRRFGWARYGLRRLTLAHKNPKIEANEGPVGNIILRDFIVKGKPFLAGRVGATELSCWCHVNGLIYYRRMASTLERQSGIYPPQWDTLVKYSELLEEAIRDIDVLVSFGWNNEWYLRPILSPSVAIVRPKALEPYFFSNEGWWHQIGGKKILFVTSFATDIKNRFTEDVLRKLWPEEKTFATLMPTRISAIDTPYGWDPQTQRRFPNFTDLLEYLKQEISVQDFDLALLGCGAYGLPLSAWLKKQGKMAIYLGGVIQVWGGIKGKRFVTLPPWNRVINEHWISPPAEKTPVNFNKVADKGAYW